jgi:hypothetical protein
MQTVPSTARRVKAPGFTQQGRPPMKAGAEPRIRALARFPALEARLPETYRLDVVFALAERYSPTWSRSLTQR